ncbi:MAG: hypothetical protein Q9166_007195 [cf. Caloplaca sp. 2 TL-2023]
MSLLVLIPIILLLPSYIIYKPPHLLIRYFQYRWPDVLWHVPLSSTNRVVALTIDDAPSEYTEEILEILKANGATTTFFVIGSPAKGREDVLRRLVREGMELGNHAMHDEPSRSLSDNILIKHIKSVEKIVDDAYAPASVENLPPRYFRPGSGFFHNRMRKVVHDLGYRLVLGSIYPHDPQIPYPWANARHILSMLRPGGIIICHDRRKWTAPMLRRVLPEMKRRGYRVVTVSELMRQGTT